MKDRGIIKNYLKKLYTMTKQDYYRWCLQHGKNFNRLAKFKNQKLLKSARHSTKTRECYYNSQMMTLNSGSKVHYYEGWYVTDNLPMPLEHGFNVYNGKVIDTTAYSKFKVLEYFGVKIPISFVRQNVEDTGMAEALLFKYYRHSKH